MLIFSCPNRATQGFLKVVISVKKNYFSPTFLTLFYFNYLPLGIRVICCFAKRLLLCIITMCKKD